MIHKTFAPPVCISPPRLGLALAGALLSLPVLAQDAAPIARVEITGSNIRRAQAETASPVQTLNAADIEKSGKSSVAELLQTLAVDNQGSVPTTFGNGFAAGASGVSLRGLGTASTLVLLNGRRVAPYGLADDGQKVFADLNIIPLEAVERVEILKDGASAIYGSDAIAGVVNVILRRDYQGTAIKGNYGKTKDWDGRDARAAITHGFGDIDKDRYNVLLNLEYSEKAAIWNRDRAGRGAVGRSDLRDLGFSAQETLSGAGAITTNNAAGSAVNGNVRNPDTLDYYNRGNLAGVGFTRTFPGAACGNFTTHPQGDPGGGCLTDAAQQYGQIQPKQKNINFFGRAAWQLVARQGNGPDLLHRAEVDGHGCVAALPTPGRGLRVLQIAGRPRLVHSKRIRIAWHKRRRSARFEDHLQAIRQRCLASRGNVGWGGPGAAIAAPAELPGLDREGESIA